MTTSILFSSTPEGILRCMMTCALFPRGRGYSCISLAIVTSREMPSLVREPLIEEQIYDSVVATCEYISYTVRQLIKFLPCLWAGYERGRRKEEKMSKAAQKQAESGGRGKLVHRTMDVQLEDRTKVLWANLFISLDNFDEPVSRWHEEMQQT
jgi:hypothetical protein